MADFKGNSSCTSMARALDAEAVLKRCTKLAPTTFASIKAETMRQQQTLGHVIVRAPSNTLVLSLAQGLFTAALAIDLTLTGLTGYALAPAKSLATFPFATITVAGAVTTMWASSLIERLGRRIGFALGAAICAVGGLISVWSVMHGNFWLFCLGTAAVGIFQSFAQFYALAAADSVPTARKARAVSSVMAGGVIAAVIGPALAAWSKSLLPTLFAGSYLMVALLGTASAVLIGTAFRNRDPVDTVAIHTEETARDLRTVFAQPISRAALANNVIGGSVMMFVMTAAPIAAVANHHTIDDGAGIIQWHLVGMYAPSLFAGRLIDRFGMPIVLFSGMALSAACALVALGSTSLPAFYVSLLCLGVGWNFMYVGGTTLLASSYRPHERARVQGMANLVRYGCTAFATLAAGPLLQTVGWSIMNLLMLPPLLAAAVMTCAWVRSGKGLVP